MPLGARKTMLIMGVIWGVWHWPVIAMGYNYGVEAEAAWQLSRSWRLEGMLALLRTQYERFDAPTVALAGREQAHAAAAGVAIGR